VTRVLVRVARAIYRGTPVPAIRRLYFGTFCRVMRDKRIRASIGGSAFDLDLGEMIDVALFLEQYEPDVGAALARHCRPGMTVLDIGANIGAHTLRLGRLVTPAGAVYAFEPTDFAFNKLKQNISLNHAPHVHPVKVALSDRTVARQVIKYRASWTTSGRRKDGESIVDFVRLDDWSAASGVDQIDLIKIDIDGNEFEALAGGMQLIERSLPVIVMEAVWSHFADKGRNPFVLLERAGYSFQDAKSDVEYATAEDVERLFPHADPEMTTSFNVIARPSAHATRG